MGSNFSLNPISCSVVCAAISAAANPTASIAPTVEDVARICFVLILLDNDAKVSGSVIISFVTFSAVSLPTCFLVAWDIAVPAAFLTTPLPTKPPIPAPIIFNGSSKATPKLAANPVINPLPPSW